MPLSSAQVVELAEIIGETPDATQSALDSLARIYDAGELTAIENAVAADVTVYAARKDKTHLRLEGGRDGVRLDYGVSLEALRERNQQRLGLSVGASAISSCGSVLKGVRW